MANRIIIVYESETKLATPEQCEAFSEKIITHFVRGGFTPTGGVSYMGQWRRGLGRGRDTIQVVIDESDDIPEGDYRGHWPRYLIGGDMVLKWAGNILSRVRR